MESIKSWVYRFFCYLARIVYPHFQIEGIENLPKEPCIIISNHCQINGPVTADLYFPGKRAIWCAGQMMRIKEVPGYSYKDFWCDKPKHSQWIYKILSYLIAPFCVCIFTKAHTISVYHDQRIISTFKNTIAKLNEGANIIIFPEHDATYNHILQDFQEGFVDVARLYHKQTGKALQFIPMYTAPHLKKMYLGAPIQFQPDYPIQKERKRICRYLMQSISEIATTLPRHKVICYRKRLNTYNRPLEEENHEKTGC